MMLLSLVGEWRVVQIPVNFRTRQGKPGTTEDVGQAFGIGLQMIRLVLAYRTRKRAIVHRLNADGVVNNTPEAIMEPRPGGKPAQMFPRISRLRRRRMREPTQRERR